MAIGPQASQARSLSSDRARTRLGRHVATEREPKLSRYIATERAHGVATEITARSLISDRPGTRLGRYVANEHAPGSVIT